VPDTVRAKADLEAHRAGLAELSATFARSNEPQHRAGLLLANYSCEQLTRACEWLEGPNDLLALALRNLIETWFWTRYIGAAESNASNFLSESEIDGNELIKTAVPAILEAQVEHYAALNELLEDARNDRRRRADSVRDSQEEQFLYKYCSKYIHPSSWLLAEYGKRKEDPVDRAMFLWHINQYAVAIVGLLFGVALNDLAN
jgi:hypothetical protein